MYILNFEDRSHLQFTYLVLSPKIYN